MTGPVWVRTQSLDRILCVTSVEWVQEDADLVFLFAVLAGDTATENNDTGKTCLGSFSTWEAASEALDAFFDWLNKGARGVWDVPENRAASVGQE